MTIIDRTLETIFVQFSVRIVLICDNVVVVYVEISIFVSNIVIATLISLSHLIIIMVIVVVIVVVDSRLHRR